MALVFNLLIGHVMLLGEQGLRDSRVITGTSLALVVTIIFSAYFLTGTAVAPQTKALPVEQTTPGAPTAGPLTDTSPPTLTYPTTVSQDLSSLVIPRPGNAFGIAKNSDSITGNAYGIVKQEVKLSKTMIQDNVTVTAVEGEIPGHIDTVAFEAHYNGDLAPFCNLRDEFDATGLASYTTTFQCHYMGPGTYTFKVYVYDDNNTVIGDPTDSLIL